MKERKKQKIWKNYEKHFNQIERKNRSQSNENMFGNKREL